MPCILIEKLEIFNALFDKGIKPHHSNYVSSVLNFIEEKIVQKVELKHVAPETRAYVTDLAKLFASKTKSMFISTAVCIFN